MSTQSTLGIKSFNDLTAEGWMMSFGNITLDTSTIAIVNTGLKAVKGAWGSVANLAQSTVGLVDVVIPVQSALASGNITVRMPRAVGSNKVNWFALGLAGYRS